MGISFSGYLSFNNFWIRDLPTWLVYSRGYHELTFTYLSVQQLVSTFLFRNPFGYTDEIFWEVVQELCQVFSTLIKNYVEKPWPWETDTQEGLSGVKKLSSNLGGGRKYSETCISKFTNHPLLESITDSS